MIDIMGEKMLCRKRRVSVVFVSALMLSWGCFVNSSLYAAQGKVEENKNRLIETNSCPRCDLTGVDLERVNLPGANLEGANLTRANLHLATLTKANLQNSVLRSAVLKGSDLADADLRGADLRGADFTGAYLIGTKLDHKAVSNSSSEQMRPETAPLDNQGVASAAGKNNAIVPAEEPGLLDKTWGGLIGLLGLGNSDEINGVAEATTVPTGKPDDASQDQTDDGLRDASEQTNPVAASAVQGEQDAALVDGSSVEEPVVVEEDIVAETEVTAIEANTGAVRPENPKQQDVKADEKKDVLKEERPLDSAADIEKNRLRLLNTKKCYGCNLAGVDLTDKNLEGVDLEGADLTGSRLAGADLENANLKGALLIGADLKNAKLQGADLYKANLSKADLTGAKLDGALLDDVQVSDTIGYE